MVENGLDARFNQIDYVDMFSNKSIEHIGIVGRVHPLKGQDVLLQLASIFPHLQFHILGDAAPAEQAYYHELRTKAPKNINLNGWVHDLPSVVANIPLQVCIIPSRNFDKEPNRCFEAFSLVSIELSALSSLVIVRSIGALVDQAKNLELFSFENDKQLEELIHEIITKPSSELSKMTEQSYNRVMHRYSQHAFQLRLQNLFRN